METIRNVDPKLGSLEWKIPDSLIKRLAVLPPDIKKAILDDIGQDIEQYLHLMMASYLSNDPSKAAGELRKGVINCASKIKRYLR